MGEVYEPPMTESQQSVELMLLREFYLAWVDLHSTPRSNIHRKKLEAQAQLLVDRGHAVAAYRASYPAPPDPSPILTAGG